MRKKRRGVSGGVGLVFVLGVAVIVIVLMFWQSVRRPAFFRSRLLGADFPPSVRRR